MAFLLCCLVCFSCKQEHKKKDSVYTYIKPQYDLVGLQPGEDSLKFRLDDSTYNDIESFNVFSVDSTEYISFYDQRSQSVNIYDLRSQGRVKRISLSSCLKGQELFKTSVYCKSFDSIFITNMSTLYLLDGTGSIKRSINFLKEPRFALAVFENTAPPVFRDSLIYACVRPNAKETSFRSLKEWKTVYRFNLKKNSTTLHYHLPQLYQKNYFGRRLYEYSYCINHRGNFVFSFAADTVIYETNLTDHHISYYGKSRFQTGDIQPVGKKELADDQGYRNYLVRDSYGPVYFDPHQKRYLRVAKSKISEADYESKNRTKKQRIIIFDENFKIIGESLIDDNLLLNHLFFSKQGHIFARTNRKDEYALHFVRLVYKEGSVDKSQLTRNENDRN